jgi:membrane dipeptidase
MNRRILPAAQAVSLEVPDVIRRLFAVSVALGCTFLPGSAAPPIAAQAGDDLDRRARAIHERVVTLDTHVDINPSNFTAERNYTQRLDTQVDLPKMREGGLDAAFFIVYVGQSTEERAPDAFQPSGYERAYRLALAKFDAIHRLTKEIAPGEIELALSAADVPRIAATGRKVALIGVENGYPIGEDLTRVKEFHDRGARYLSLAHNGHSQLADSNTGERTGFKWNGLSPLGRKVVAELNRVGIMVDVSHPSKATMMQTLEISRAPIIASHSSVRALADHPRNLDDEQLQALKKNGGVVQLVALSTYVKTPKPDSPERAEAVAALRKELGLPPTPVGVPRGGGSDLGQFTDAQRVEYRKRMVELNKQFPPDPPATVQEFVDHIDYVVKAIGIDHAGIASDFDGGGGIAGWNNAAETSNVTRELVRRGYTETQIAKIWSGNLLRVMARVEQVAKELQKGRSE